MATFKEIAAAQEVFEQWFCEALGLDMSTKESEVIIRKMLDAAEKARATNRKLVSCSRY